MSNSLKLIEDLDNVQKENNSIQFYLDFFCKTMGGLKQYIYFEMTWLATL